MPPLHAAELLRQHARHQPGLPADERRPGFRTRLVLAATLGGNYGVYNGFEICEAAPVPGKEEYLNSEKYEIRAWDMDQPGNIKDDIRLLNRLRRTTRHCRQFTNLTFYNAWNDNVLYYASAPPDLTDFLLFARQPRPARHAGGQFEVPLWEFGLPDDASIEVEDLVTATLHLARQGPAWLELEPRPALRHLAASPGGPR
jgi:starch synthase (maltosyl-transferring)